MIAATPKDFYAANFNPVGGEDVGNVDVFFARTLDAQILCRHLPQNFRKITRDRRQSERVLYHARRRNRIAKIMATKNTYDCSKCPGYCCSYDYIETKASDVTRLAKHHGLPVATAREKFTRTVEHEGKTIRVLRHRKDHVYKSMCMFFDQDERRCTIYEGRPQVCRDYPNGSTCGYYNFIKFERKHQGDESFIPSA